MNGSVFEFAMSQGMRAVFEHFSHGLAVVEELGWGDLVQSMRGAIEDRSHVVNMGYAFAALVFIWINWRMARLILRWLQAPEHG